jgi:hypothetical protein
MPRVGLNRVGVGTSAAKAGFLRTDSSARLKSCPSRFHLSIESHFAVGRVDPALHAASCPPFAKSAKDGAPTVVVDLGQLNAVDASRSPRSRKGGETWGTRAANTQHKVRPLRMSSLFATTCFGRDDKIVRDLGHPGTPITFSFYPVPRPRLPLAASRLLRRVRPSDTP